MLFRSPNRFIYYIANENPCTLHHGFYGYSVCQKVWHLIHNQQFLEGYIVEQSKSLKYNLLLVDNYSFGLHGTVQHATYMITVYFTRFESWFQLLLSTHFSLETNCSCKFFQPDSWDFLCSWNHWKYFISDLYSIFFL